MTGMLPFCKIEEDSLQIPLFTQDLYKWKMSSVSGKEKFRVAIFYYFIRFLNLISPPLFSHLSKRGVLVIYWVLNEETDF